MIWASLSERLKGLILAAGQAAFLPETERAALLDGLKQELAATS